MAKTKQLVLVIEGTAALGPYWNTIVSDYLEKIIRSFCGNEDTEPAGPIAELTLVNFNARAPSSSTLFSDLNAASLVQTSGWTKNADVFMEWLSGIHFSGGGASCDAAIAEGLAEVLMMFPSVNGSQNHERHCILVAASNPYPWPTAVYKPPDYLGTRSESHSSDAKTVAKYFKQCRVSLSVISPMKLPKLKAIYDAAKRNPLETEFTIDNVKNPDYLLLISQDFMEASAVLSQPEITNLPSNKSPMIIDLTRENIPPATVKEPISTVSSIASAQSSSTLSWQEMQAESAILPGTSTNVVIDNVATNVGPAQGTPSALVSQLSNYIAKLWEGYRDRNDSESLANDWPSTMQIDRLLSEDDIKSQTRNYNGKLDYLLFQAMNEHYYLRRMQENNLCMIIRLPSQTLMLTVTADRVSTLVGRLVPQEMVRYLPIQPQEQGQDSWQWQQSMSYGGASSSIL
ncbi:hypothetical protein L2E82_43185 [Cichorium intybus]|uniref:Uncharacterized protein n=1 Tax=Cichorium intybus TaxID=13427 RepID=A0ACB8ZN84_CICIN|nr:hypothetical protein L2E82_43185 [Cichorium intybus]